MANVVDPTPVGELIEEAAAHGTLWIQTGALQTDFPAVTTQVVPDEAELTAVLDAWLFGRLVERVGIDGHAEIGAWVARSLGAGLAERDRQRMSDLSERPQLTEVFTHDIDLTNAAEDIEDSTRVALERHPGLESLWQTCEPCVGTQAQTLAALGLSGDDRPLIAGFYSNARTRRAVRDGTADGLVQVDTRLQGLVAVDQAIEHWSRQAPFRRPARALDAYSLPLGRPWVITRENVGPDPDTLEVPDLDCLRYFTEKWRAEFHGT